MTRLIHIAPVAFNEDEYYVDRLIPSIKQTKSTFCGVASILMALIGGGKKEYALNSILTDKWQYDIAKEVGIYSAEGGITGNGVEIQIMKDYLQTFFPENSMGDTYRVKIFTKFSIEPIEKFLTFALLCDTVPIIRVDEPQRLSYYPNNYSLGAHYIVVDSIDLSTGKVGVIDPHYDDRYYGRHTVTIDEIKDLVYSENNLWMCVYTRIPDPEGNHG